MTTFEIEVDTAVSVPDPLPDLLVAAATATLTHQALDPPNALTILLTDDAAIEALNSSFRQEKRATDVLSFPAGEPMPGMPPYLGDIAISWPFAQRQAAAAGHAAAAEVQLLVVHGVLHLLGHDHADEAEKRVMWAAQTAVLQQLGLEQISPTETEHD